MVSPGGDAWFRALYDDPCFYLYVVNTAARHTRDVQLREDCCQEAWLLILEAGPILTRVEYRKLARQAIRNCVNRWEYPHKQAAGWCHALPKWTAGDLPSRPRRRHNYPAQRARR